MPITTDSKTRKGRPQAGAARDDSATSTTDSTTDSTIETTTDGATETRPMGLVRLLDETGVRHDVPEYDRWLTDLDGDEGDDLLLRLYQDMVVVRRIDTEGTALQRQGQLAIWPPLRGQEAAQIGSGHALRQDDFVFSSYREHGVALVRGVQPVQMLPVWRGSKGSGWDPYAVNMATMQVIIGAQALHGVGYAVGIQADAERGVLRGVENDMPAADREGTAAAVSYFGDGAMSQGDVNEAFIFGATWNAPVVFFCQNNQWAISEPVALQSRVPLAQRAAGFGMAGVRVDGNDVLAVLAVTREALHRARTGGGPTLIEAVTYRMGPHTTADDPTRYRDAAEVEAWAQRDPITRFEAWLRERGTLTDEAEERVRAEADRVAAELRAGCFAIEDPPALSIFDHVYAEPHTTVQAERDAYEQYLAGFADADGTQNGGAR